LKTRRFGLGACLVFTLLFAVIGCDSSTSVATVNTPTETRPPQSPETGALMPTLSIGNMETYEKGMKLLVSNISCAMIARYIPGNGVVLSEQPYWQHADILQPAIQAYIKSNESQFKPDFLATVQDMRKGMAAKFDKHMEQWQKDGVDPRKDIAKLSKAVTFDLGCEQLIGSTVAYIDVHRT